MNKRKTTHIRVFKTDKKKLKIKAAQEDLTIANLINLLLKK